MVSKYVTCFFYTKKDSTERVNPLIWPYIVGCLLYGLGFIALGDWGGVGKSSLYKAMYMTDSFLPVVWGSAAVAGSVLALVFISTRVTWLGELSTFFGFLTWVYAAWVYADQGVWLVMATVGMTNAYFWAWFYLRIKKYKKQRELGQHVDPE